MPVLENLDRLSYGEKLTARDELNHALANEEPEISDEIAQILEERRRLIDSGEGVFLTTEELREKLFGSRGE